jgi:hypothetical protein
MYFRDGTGMQQDGKLRLLHKALRRHPIKILLLLGFDFGLLVMVKMMEVCLTSSLEYLTNNQ